MKTELFNKAQEWVTEEGKQRSIEIKVEKRSSWTEPGGFEIKETIWCFSYKHMQGFFVNSLDDKFLSDDEIKEARKEELLKEMEIIGEN